MSYWGATVITSLLTAIPVVGVRSDGAEIGSNGG